MLVDYFLYFVPVIFPHTLDAKQCTHKAVHKARMNYYRFFFPMSVFISIAWRYMRKWRSINFVQSMWPIENIGEGSKTIKKIVEIKWKKSILNKTAAFLQTVPISGSLLRGICSSSIFLLFFFYWWEAHRKILDKHEISSYWQLFTVAYTSCRIKSRQFFPFRFHPLTWTRIIKNIYFHFSLRLDRKVAEKNGIPIWIIEMRIMQIISVTSLFNCMRLYINLSFSIQSRPHFSFYYSSSCLSWIL